MNKPELDDGEVEVLLGEYRDLLATEDNEQGGDGRKLAIEISKGKEGSLVLSDEVGNVAAVRTLENHVEALYGFEQAGKPRYVVRHRFWLAQHPAQDVARMILQEPVGS